MSLADNVRMVITIRVGIDSTVRPHPALNANNLQPLFAPNEHRDRQYTVKKYPYIDGYFVASFPYILTEPVP